MVKLKRFDICLVNLDPTIGSEMKKKRPVVIISPDSMNLSRLKTIIVAPMTSRVRDDFPTRVTLNFNNKKGQIAKVLLDYKGLELALKKESQK